MAVVVLALSCVGVAYGAVEATPTAGSFTGQYKVTIRITNTPSTPTHWIYEAHPSCPSRCQSVSFRQRLTSEKTWRSTVLTFDWNGKAYALARTLRKAADCRAKSGATVKKGYDIVSNQDLRIDTVVNGRVTKWSDAGRDDYVPNAAGRRAQCAKGAYIFAIEGAGQ